MRRLLADIAAALEADDLAGAARAQRELRKVQLESPSEACRLHIQEDCRAATAMLRLGDAVDPELRIKAAKKLGRWLRWRRTTAKDLVPVTTALEGLLWAMRSEPEVAWAAQCALFHAAQCADRADQSVREGTRGTISRLLLNEPTPFPLTLPNLTPRDAENHKRALQTAAVQDFFSQLRALTLVDAGYGDDADCQDLAASMPFCKVLGRSFGSLQELKLLGFEDCAMTLVLPHLAMPKLRSLQLVGACQSAEAQRAILALLNRHGAGLVELELNVWTELLREADDPLADVYTMPKVRRLTVRAPPLRVRWEHLARTFPALEELTFLYDQDFALNSLDVLDASEDPGKQQDLLEKQANWLYRDAALFAQELHMAGFRRLARQCDRLQEIRLAIADSSFGYDVTKPEDRLALCWRREASGRTPFFRRDHARNNAVRAALEARSGHLADAAAASSLAADAAFAYSSDSEDEVSEEEALAAGAAVILQVIRYFDDPSLEAEFGLRWH